MHISVIDITHFKSSIEAFFPLPENMHKKVNAYLNELRNEVQYKVCVCV